MKAKDMKRKWKWGSGLALFDILDFFLNEYFNELNTASFNILNKFFN